MPVFIFPPFQGVREACVKVVLSSLSSLKGHLLACGFLFVCFQLYLRVNGSGHVKLQNIKK